MIIDKENNLAAMMWMVVRRLQDHTKLDVLDKKCN